MARGVVFFITLNEGYEYVGTNPVDEALRDRMTYSIRMSYVPKRVETSTLVKRTSVDDETVGKLTEFAQSVRRNLPVSTRQLLGAASLQYGGRRGPDGVAPSAPDYRQGGRRRQLGETPSFPGSMGSVGSWPTHPEVPGRKGVI